METTARSFPISGSEDHYYYEASISSYENYESPKAVTPMNYTEQTQVSYFAYSSSWCLLTILCDIHS